MSAEATQPDMGGSGGGWLAGDAAEAGTAAGAAPLSTARSHRSVDAYVPSTAVEGSEGVSALMASMICRVECGQRRSKTRAGNHACKQETHRDDRAVIPAGGPPLAKCHFGDAKRAARLPTARCREQEGRERFWCQRGCCPTEKANQGA